MCKNISKQYEPSRSFFLTQFTAHFSLAETKAVLGIERERETDRQTDRLDESRLTLRLRDIWLFASDGLTNIYAGIPASSEESIESGSQRFTSGLRTYSSTTCEQRITFYIINYYLTANATLHMPVHKSFRSGASKGTPGDAKCVTEILGGTHIRKLGGQSLKLLPPDVIF